MNKKKLGTNLKKIKKVHHFLSLANHFPIERLLNLVQIPITNLVNTHILYTQTPAFSTAQELLLLGSLGSYLFLSSLSFSYSKRLLFFGSTTNRPKLGAVQLYLGFKYLKSYDNVRTSQS